MEINKLFDGLEFEWLTECKLSQINNISHKASDITKGDCYICLNTNEKGMQNLALAASNGAELVVVDKFVKVPEGVCVIKVDNIRRTYAILAKNYFGKACDKLKMIGVVGTNGKSTTSYLIWNLLTKNNLLCGMIGTGFYMIGKSKFKTNMTTPDPMELHMILSVMAVSGVKVVVMEVSSHAIYLEKVAGIKYNIGVWTNLSQDHLDFFGNIQKLEEVKHSFFMDGFAQISVVNVDDASGARLANKLALPVVTYAIDNDADVRVNKYELSSEGSRFSVQLFRESTIFDSLLVGKYNIYNILAAVVVCKLIGGRIKYLICALKEILPLDGRANLYTHEKVNYVIDYAHTPDGLKNILLECKKLTYGKLIAVFGAGGDRDKDKRHKMGKVAKQFADIVIVTSDNPRYENPQAIMQDIVSGISDMDNIFLIEDRRQAVAKAIDLATEYDTILLAGKGAEEYFEKNGRKYQYNDKNTLEELLGVKWK